MNLLRYASLLLLSGLLTACTTPRIPAPISERSAPGGKSIVTPAAATPATASATSAAGKPVIRDADKRGFYTVKRGDTLIHIALEVGQNYRDIIAWNNLTNPNDIKVEQVLRVAPPEGSPAITTVQAASVASNSAGEVRPLAAIAPGAMKTMPRGEKRPYSEANLAEMKKGEGNAVGVAAIPTPAAPQVPVKMVEPAADEDVVTWMWPTEGKLASGFDETKKGIDIAGTSGQAVFAAASGKILYANSIRGYGNLVIVKHTNNLLSAYAHNKTILVKENQTVIKGQKIAEMGNTDTDAVKLHFEIRQQGKPIDPLKLLPGR